MLHETTVLRNSRFARRGITVAAYMRCRTYGFSRGGSSSPGADGCKRVFGRVWNVCGLAGVKDGSHVIEWNLEFCQAIKPAVQEGFQIVWRYGHVTERRLRLIATYEDNLSNHARRACRSRGDVPVGQSMAETRDKVGDQTNLFRLRRFPYLGIGEV